MDFKQFYKTINFDIDKEIRTVLQATQGDTKSRGLLVPVVVNSVVTPITTETMNFFALKPDKTRIITAAVKDGDKFRIDFTNQTFAVPGILFCALVLYGTNGEKIADKKFKMTVDSNLEDGAIISEDERGILDRAFDLASDIVPRLEVLDLVKLETADAKESERLASETIRLASEQSRVAAEASRVTKEAERVSNETTRKSSETARVSAETARGSAETARKTAETSRVGAESGRVTAENQRVQAEGIRAGFYEDYNTQLSEIKGTETTLGARLDGTDAQLADIEQEVTEIKGALKHIKLESWTDVQKAVRDGSHKNIISVGDSFVAKYGGVDYIWDVIGINHDIPVDPRFTHSMTIQARDCLMNCAFDAPEPTNPDENIQQYGNNNYKNSNIRQWLNSNDAQFNFVKQHEFDEKPTSAPYTGAGFLHNLDPELREVIGPVKKQVAKNTITDGGGQDTFEDTVFLLSRVEVYGGTEGDSTGEKPYEYYSVLAPSATSAELSGRIKYLSGASRHWWLRSPDVGYSYSPRGVNPTGNISNYGAHDALGLAPACTIY